MANNPNIPGNRGSGNPPGGKTPAPTAPLPPQQTGRGAAPGDQVGSSQQADSKGTIYFKSSLPSTNLHMPNGGDPVRFRNYFYQTSDQKTIDFLRNNFVGRSSGPLSIEEVSESEFNKSQQNPEAEGDMSVDVGRRTTNADGVSIVEPVVTPIPGQQNMMNYPQPPLHATPPTPGPHVAPEVSTDPADKGGVKPGLPPVRTQQNPGAPAESTTRPQDQPNVPSDQQQAPDEAPAARPDADK